MAQNQKLLSVAAMIIRRLREQSGISQEELAARSGLSRSMIDKCERRERLPSLDILFKLSGGLKISASEIVRLIEQELGK